MKTKLPEYIAAQYSTDKRKRRREHRKNARELRAFGSSIFKATAWWNLQQARYLGR